MNSEPGLSQLQKELLHAALKDIHYAREKLKGVNLMQRYGGQPKLLTATNEIDSHLSRLWHLIDGLHQKTELAAQSTA